MPGRSTLGAGNVCLEAFFAGKLVAEQDGGAYGFEADASYPVSSFTRPFRLFYLLSLQLGFELLAGDFFKHLR
jgi:hypothetical protein